MGICKYCGKEFPDKSLGGHVARCKMNPNYEKTCANDRKNLRKGTETFVKKYKLPILEFELTCPKCGKVFIVKCTQNDFDKGRHMKFCSRSCANTRMHTKNSIQQISNSVTKYYSNVENRKKQCKTYTCKYCGKNFTVLDKRNTGGIQYCSSECKNAWLKENAKWGGCRDGSGRGKSGWYKGIYCSSTWELAYVIYHIDHNIPIERCKEKRSYTYKGKVHNYYPDFVTPDGIIEIKGYITEQWIEKEKQNPDVKTLYKDDMKPYLQYVHDNYTNDIASLYDGSKPENIVGKMVWLHKDGQNVFIQPKLLNEYLDNGWIRGRINRK